MKKKYQFNFKKKNIFITGSNGFLGLKISNAFYNLGANLILTDIHENSIMKDKDKNIFYKKCDLRRPNDVKEFTKFISKKYKKLDAVINNASYTGDSQLKGWNATFKNQNTINWGDVFQISLNSNFEFSNSFYNALKKSKDGSIVNISSIYGFMAPDWNIYSDTNLHNPAGYGVSKSGLIYLTKWLASSMAPAVRVNSISPGGINRKQPIAFKKKYISKVPLGRMCEEDDIIGAVLFLSSPLSKYITGQNIVIDGGYSII
jgi:NAD(P)-dependent dehydrogenase (short-subunit alcohol dehydrogenase family)